MNCPHHFLVGDELLSVEKCPSICYAMRKIKLDDNNHSVFLMHYYLVSVVEYRGVAVDNVISLRLKEIFDYMTPK